MVSLNHLNLLGVHLEIYSLTSRDIIIIREGQSLTWNLSSYILSLFNSWNSQQFGETLHKHLNSQKAFKSAFCQISGWLMFWSIEFSFFVLIPLQSNNILHRKKTMKKKNASSETSKEKAISRQFKLNVRYGRLIFCLFLFLLSYCYESLLE